MRKTLLALATGLAATTALAAGQQGGHHEAPKDGDVDRTISFEAGDMRFTPDHWMFSPARR
ncbi:hypothetical protein [Halomonas sp.]|uniref:hypothetical protein n=1 Tax=Halomonas sp. TaxID=1486246 RepID=UPI00298DF880|nr:hypothetical protein [Halomonas sp.]MDW7745840.1 hypothetical protein [Halomonas sp.]